jgi:hypothetical protein
MGMVMNDREKARSFGIAVGAVSGLIAGHSLWRGHGEAAIAWGVASSALIGLGLTRPAWLRGHSAVWWALANALGWINSRVLLSALFYLVLTPLGVTMRLTGWDPLHRRRPFGADRSGWVPYPSARRDPKHYDRMY